MSFFAAFVARLSDALDPLFGASATAAAIVLFTLCVRLVLHPMARAAVRGERVRARLAPRLTELQRRHRSDPDRLRRELGKLRAREGASPVAGCLPMLLQLPVFFAMYHLFTTDEALLGHTLLGAPLGGRWFGALAEGGVLGGPGLVYAGLFVLVGAVATWTYVRTRRLMAAAPASAAAAPGGAAMTRMLPLLSFGTLLTVAVVPLAAALYVVTSTTWTAVERAALRAGHPDDPDAAPAPAPAGPASAVPAASAARSGRPRRRSTT
ncbi:YidC/Oxa1 family membrane protein insertase [Streptomyces abyssalis]|uniref:YidC/Oxa1 family membrane protein insertase n=1 Tax=Streptomyces abyssalis TaxID=933944 RepID=UPI00085C04A9|nr:membrane protein insertase YidC [Streptomyces abyssalis]